VLIASSRQAKTNRLLAVFCGVSFVAHAAFVIVYAVIAFGDAAPAQLDRTIVKTRLVKLGKQRDEKLLPRIAKSAPPPKAEKGPELPAPPKEEAPAPEPEPEPQPTASDILEQFTQDNERPDLNSLISDRLGEPVDEGHELGHKLGDDITGKLKADYNDILIAKINSAYKLPQTLTDTERIQLRAVLYVTIAADGSLTSAELNPASGNSAFDSAVLAAAKKSAPFDPPPLQLRGFYSGGVGLNFCPISCK
jgi:TonB family protein